MFVGSLTKTALAVTLAFGLAACDSAEDRAEKHYQTSLELLSGGDENRALVELRNVLALNEFHQDARKLYAKTMLNRGNLSEAYSNYLRIVEENPSDAESRVVLARMAISALNWGEAKRHADVLKDASADVEGADAVDLVMRFFDAVQDNDALAIQSLTEEAEELAQKYPDDENIRRVLIEGYVKTSQTDRALERLDQAIELEPQFRLYYMMKTSILAENQDLAGLEAHIRDTIEAFPEDQESKASLVRLLTATGRIEDAEEFLRSQIGVSSEPIAMHATLIAFLKEAYGDEEAIAEIDKAVGLYENPGVLQALRAGILYDRGERETGIAEMEALIADEGEATSENTNNFKIALSRMLVSTGNEVGARKLVEEVLASDGTNVDALLMSASWKIEADDVDGAVESLRLALDQDPENSDAMTMMARAHRRAGETELAQDLLALAAEASEYAPDESLRFANLLIEEERYRPAEDVLVSSLRNNPGNFRVLRALGNLYLRSEDFQRAEGVENTLRRLGTDSAVREAERMRLRILSQQEGRGQALAYLQGLAEQSSDDTSLQFTLLSEKLRDREYEEALAIANKIVEDNPDNPTARLVLGNTLLVSQAFTDAEGTYLSIVEDFPEFGQAWLQLVRVQSAQGNRDGARSTLDDALAANPQDGNLLWAKASFLERDNDIDGAIEIYEELYALNSNSAVVANNLASLLVTYRNDEDSLDRAFTIGRRLRGTNVPPFQDTYGWIMYRRGNFEEAVAYLKPAADALQSDPIVQYHLGSAYLALGREEEALIAFRQAVEIAGEGDQRSQISEAAEEVARLTEKGVNE